MHSQSPNAESFPLLRLPGEIREQILLNVVGQQKIHILHVVLIQPEKMKKAPWDWRGPYNCSSKLPSGYHHCVCRADTTHDNRASEGSKLAIMPRNTDYELYHQSCEMRQKTWHINPMGKFETQRLRWSQMDLSILRVSRQLYAEANNLFWKDTTFAFTDPNSLIAFLQDLNDTQIATLQNLELSTTQTQTPSTWSEMKRASVTNDDPLGLARFGRVSKMLGEMGSLTSLSLHLTHRGSSYMARKTTMKRQISKGFMSAFGDLFRLDIQHINVTIWERPYGRCIFTRSELKQLASEVRERLMADSKAYRTSGKDRRGWTGSE